MKLYLKNLKVLLTVHLVALGVFLLFRVVLLLTQWEQIETLPNAYELLSKSFLMGLRFDNALACYILSIPLVIYSIAALFNYNAKWLSKSIAIYYIVLYGSAFVLSTANIPYFDTFFKHLNSSVFNWAGEQSFVFEMILKDVSFLISAIVALIILISYSIFILRLFKKNYTQATTPSQPATTPSLLATGNSITAPSKTVTIFKIAGLFVILAFLCLLGMRGRVALKSPIRVGTAYFSNYPIVNQLGLNPIYVFMRSTLDSKKNRNLKLNFIPDKEAISNVQGYFGIEEAMYHSPIARLQEAGKGKNYNVVLILMEGISAQHLETNGGISYLPFLDSLTKTSLYFSNCYSAGIHTMNGICGGVFAQPSLLQQHPFKTTEIPIYSGFPNVLSHNGYQTAYFSTHDDQFDNIGGVMSANGVEFIMSQKDYPANRVLSNLGVADDYMFERAILELNRMASNDEPFFAAMLTASNHAPIVIPDYFTPKSKEAKIQILEYSNWALAKFFAMAEKESWYDSTIFIITGDHGNIVGPQLYDMAISYNHTPMFIISPDIKVACEYTAPSGQIDIFPTVMGLLDLTYVNNTFGEDLLTTEREFIYFNADDVVGCVSDSLFYTYHLDGRESLYNYKEKSSINIIDKHRAKADEMKKYALSMMQASEYVTERGLINYFLGSSANKNKP